MKTDLHLPSGDTREYFEQLFVDSDDPWRFQSSWYEARKRALTLGCLPAATYGSAYEPGCANGELSAALAGRCRRLLVSDIAAGAVELARRRLAAFAHAEVRRSTLPEEWPDERFDLVVVSELGYYLDGDTLDRFAAKVRESLNDEGTVLACHWRWPIEGCSLDGDEVHRRLADRLGMAHVCGLCEADLRIDVWSTTELSVGQREGLCPGPTSETRGESHSSMAAFNWGSRSGLVR